LTFNFSNYSLFRKSEGGSAMLFFGHCKVVALLIAVPYILGSELAFFRGARYFVQLKEQVVGIFVLREEPDTLYVGSLAVTSEYRGCGVATYILDYSAKVAGKLGKKCLELTVLKKNIPARRLYEKTGFVTKRNKKWSLVLRKTLNPDNGSASIR
jgi:ribosomal protein S18 acetylase RimI-like enzyme